MKTITMFVNLFELAFISIVPVYLYGWLRGLLIVSALTSLMHIVLLLKRMTGEPK